jgi:hypothetical protein
MRAQILLFLLTAISQGWQRPAGSTLTAKNSTL